MIRDEIFVGELVIRSPRAWRFYPFNNIILARREPRVGSLQITLAYRDRVALGGGHGECRRALSEFTSLLDIGDLEQEAIVRDTRGPFWGAGRLDPDAFRKAWYRLVDGSLALALYQCHSDRLAEAGREIEEAGEIVRSLRFT